MNLLNDSDFAAAFRRVKASNHERRHGHEGRSVYSVPDNELIPGRDDLNQIPVDKETTGNPEVVADIRKHLKRRNRNAPNRVHGPEDAA